MIRQNKNYTKRMIRATTKAKIAMASVKAIANIMLV
jgi:hypothetical protein